MHTIKIRCIMGKDMLVQKLFLYKLICQSKQRTAHTMPLSYQTFLPLEALKRTPQTVIKVLEYSGTCVPLSVWTVCSFLIFTTASCSIKHPCYLAVHMLGFILESDTKNLDIPGQDSNYLQPLG